MVGRLVSSGREDEWVNLCKGFIELILKEFKKKNMFILFNECGKMNIDDYILFLYVCYLFN